MQTFDQIKQELSRALSDSELAGICLKILDYIHSQRPENVKMLTYSSFARAAKTEISNPALVLAVNYLANPYTVGALEKHYLVYSHGDDVGQVISDEDVAAAMQERLLVLPDGQEVEDVEAHLVAYFKPSDALTSARVAN